MKRLVLLLLVGCGSGPQLAAERPIEVTSEVSEGKFAIRVRNLSGRPYAFDYAVAHYDAEGRRRFQGAREFARLEIEAGGERTLEGLSPWTRVDLEVR